jgi:hypothetical protein
MRDSIIHVNARIVECVSGDRKSEQQVHCYIYIDLCEPREGLDLGYQEYVSLMWESRNQAKANTKGVLDVGEYHVKANTKGVLDLEFSM